MTLLEAIETYLKLRQLYNEARTPDAIEFYDAKIQRTARDFDVVLKRIVELEILKRSGRSKQKGRPT